MTEPALRVRLFRDDEPLPPADSPVFQDALAGNIFYSRAWLDAFRSLGVPAGDRMRVYVLQGAHDEAPVALLPAVYSRLYSAHPRARVLHFLQPEAMVHMPLFSPGAPDPAQGLARVIDCLRAASPPHDILRFSPLRPDAPLHRSLTAALRGRGHALQLYRVAREYYESTVGLSSRDYLAARAPALYERLALARQGLEAGPQASLRLVRDLADVEGGWRDCQNILDANESDPEPESPAYLPGAMRIAAQAGALRLGLLSLGLEPIAAQLWIVSGGKACCLRTWSMLRYASLWPDDLLCERLCAHLIDEDRVAELSFGALDDAFIPDWAQSTREQFGLAAFNLRTWRGVKGALRHVGADVLKTSLGRGAGTR